MSKYSQKYSEVLLLGASTRIIHECWIYIIRISNIEDKEHKEQRYKNQYERKEIKKPNAMAMAMAEIPKGRNSKAVL